MEGINMEVEDQIFATVFKGSSTDFYVKEVEGRILLSPASKTAKEWSERNLPFAQEGNYYIVPEGHICTALTGIEADGMIWEKL